MLTFFMTIEDINDRNKLEKIYTMHKKEMYITAYSILKNKEEAEDAVHDAILKVYKNLIKISKINCKKTRSFLVIIVRNISINKYNKRKGIILFDEGSEDNIIDNEPFIEDQMLQNELSDTISNHLNEINRAYADIITLRYYYELNISEISDILGITENNVSVKLNRAKKALRKLLEKEGAIYE